MAVRGGVRVRYAPSPTGELHLGGLRTALFNFLLARSQGGRFLVRLEDTHQNREVAGAGDRLLTTLSRFGRAADEPVQRQSSRLPLYKEQSDRLVENGGACPCFCSAERIGGMRTAGAVAYDRRCRGLAAGEPRARIEAAHCAAQGATAWSNCCGGTV
mmetsp:Transcript_15758/g.25754  ORF Transcript_15758/g.25754 Transcript_15758/m.25754 type:complete len:158 (+) Transcript_15758:3149-3622(+)